VRILPSAKSSLSPARKAAFRILLEVENGQAHSDTLLRSSFVDRLPTADRHLATALVLGVLRWQVRLDQQIKEFLAKPNAKLDTEVLIALRIAAFQIFYLERIPARAAIDESVELTKTSGHKFAARMVNAVLRKLAGAHEAQESARIHESKKKPLAEETSAPLVKGTGFSPYIAGTPEETRASAPETVAALALATAHPAWLVERWVAHFGLEAAHQICAHGQRQPALNLRLTDAKAEAELIAEKIELAPGALLSAARTLVSGDATHTQIFTDLRARIQDEGSQLVAELAAVCTPADQKVENILDACAAPGGKTLILAERHATAKIMATEINEPRCAEMRKRLEPSGGRVECRNIDATALPSTEKFDLILVDAPCTGTGTLGRNPEIRHRLRAEDLARQAERQGAILAAAFSALRPGGRLVYSTCSLEPEENDAAVATLLAAQPHARQLPLSAAIDALDARRTLATGAAERLRTSLTPEGALRLLPGVQPTDGFFVALIEQVD
jgi:16S rRNA (cytosine967-C5)-methyltransferase